jgi:hypothetical protein
MYSTKNIVRKTGTFGSPARNTRSSKKNSSLKNDAKLHHDKELEKPKTRKASKMEFEETHNKRLCLCEEKEEEEKEENLSESYVFESSHEEDDADDRTWGDIDCLSNISIPPRDSPKVIDFFERLLGIHDDVNVFIPTHNCDESITEPEEVSNLLQLSSLSLPLEESFYFPFNSLNEDEFEDLSSLF